MNESQYIGKGGDENNSQTDRRKEADEKTIDTFIAEFQELLHFVLDPLDADSYHDEDAGRKGRNRHHDRIRQEIKEAENIHTKDGEGRKRAESERKPSMIIRMKTAKVEKLRLQPHSSWKVETLVFCQKKSLR